MQNPLVGLDVGFVEALHVSSGLFKEGESVGKEQLVRRSQDEDGREGDGLGVHLGAHRLGPGNGLELFHVLAPRQDSDVDVVKQQNRLSVAVEPAHAGLVGKVVADLLDRRLKEEGLARRAGTDHQEAETVVALLPLHRRHAVKHQGEVILHGDSLDQVVVEGGKVDGIPVGDEGVETISVLVRHDEVVFRLDDNVAVFRVEVFFELSSDELFHHRIVAVGQQHRVISQLLFGQGHLRLEGEVRRKVVEGSVLPLEIFQKRFDEILRQPLSVGENDKRRIRNRVVLEIGHAKKQIESDYKVSTIFFFDFEGRTKRFLFLMKSFGVFDLSKSSVIL